MIYYLRCENGVDIALARMTTHIAQGGKILNYDILTNFCSECETEERGLEVANALIGMGYAYKAGSNTRFYKIATKGHWNLLRFILIATKLYTSPLILNSVMHHLSRKQLEIFLENGEKSSHARYQIYQSAREKARKASIALIGTASNGRKDVMRVISRVVWSERDDEKWMK